MDPVDRFRIMVEFIAQATGMDTAFLKEEAKKTSGARRESGKRKKIYDEEGTAGARAGKKVGDEFSKGAKRAEHEFRDVFRTLEQMAESFDLASALDVATFGGRLNKPLENALAEAEVRSNSFWNEYERRGINAQLAVASKYRNLQQPGVSRSFAILGELQSQRKAASADLASTARVAAQKLRIDKVNAEARATAARQAGQRLNAAEKAAQERTLVAQRAGERRKTAAAEASYRRRVLVAQTSLRLITAAERQAFQAVRGLFRGIGTVGSGLGKTIADRLRVSNRELNQGTAAALGQRESIISRSFRRQTNTITTEVTKQQKVIRELQQQSSKGVIGAATGRSGIGIGGIAAGVAGGIGIAGLISAGFERYSNLERINKQFVALTQSQEKATMLLEQARAFAKTTPFDLVGVADLAKGFLAIGTATEDVMPRVKAIADAVALTGGGVPELERIQRAIGQVVSTGKLQGDELNQLAENLPGLNIRQILANQLTKGDTAALVAMQEAGDLSAQSFVDALIVGLQSDPRLVGASEDLAKTLSGRFANLKESWADLGASIIGLVATPLKAFVSGAQAAMQGLADFIKGEVTPGLQVLRTAALGAAIGIGSLLIAKAAAEALKLLGVATKFALTPFGALIGTFAAVGAAIAVLYKHSSEFRQLITRLGETLQDSFGRIGDALRVAFAQIQEALAPIFTAVSDTSDAVDNLGGAGQSLFDIIGNVLVRAINTFTSLLTNTVIPALTEVAVWLIDKILPAFEAVVDFLTGTVLPAIASAVQSVSTAIGGFVENIQSLIEVEGVLGALKTIGIRIGEAIGEGLSKVGDFIGDLFSGKNLMKAASFALEVVETIGYVLGNIVSDPRFIKALAAIAAAAAIVAFRFVEGFVRGVWENVPELLGGLVKAFKAVFTGLFRNPLAILGGALAAITAFFIAKFKIAGKISGKSFWQEFGKSSSVSSTRGLLGKFTAGLGRELSPAFSRALIQGTDTMTVVAGKRTSEAIAAQRKVMLREYQQTNRMIKALGGTAVALPKGGIDAATLAQTRDRFGELSTKMGDAASAGLLLRSQLKGVGSGLKDLATAAGQAATGQFKGAMSSIKNGVLSVGQAIKDSIAVGKSNGFGLGMQVGATIAGGITAGLSGFNVGEALAGGDAKGALAGVAGVAASALAVGSVNQLAGIGVALAGAVTAVVGFFKKSGEAAAIATKQVEGYVEALEAARKAGTPEGMAVGDVLFENIFGPNGSPESVQKLFNLLRVDVDALGQAATAGGQQFTDFTDGVAASLIDLVPLLGQFGSDLGSVQRALQVTTEAGGQNEFASRLTRALTDAGLDRQTVLGLISDIGSESGAVAQAVEAVGIRAKASLNRSTKAAEELKAAQQALNEGNTEQAQKYIENLENQARDAKDAFDDALDALRALIRGPAIDQAEATADAVLNIPDYAQTIAQATAAGGTQGMAMLGQAYRSLGDDVADVLVTGLQSGAIKTLDEAAAALQPVFNQISELEGKGLITPEQAAFLRTAIDDQFADGLPGLTAALDAATAQANIQGQIDAIPVDIAPRIVAPDGTVYESVSAMIMGERRKQGIPTYVSGSEPQTPQTTKQYETNIPIKIDTAAQADIDAAVQATAAAAKAALDELLFKDPAKVALAAPDTESVQTVANSTSATASSKLATGMKGAGKKAAEGLKQGIEQNAYLAKNAAQAMADAVIAITETVFDTGSPSRVFMGIGRFVSEGLAIGIDDGASEVESAAKKAVQDAIDATLTAVDRGRIALGEASASLFETLFKAPTGNVIDDAIGGVTSAFQGIRSAVDSAFKQSIEVQGKSGFDLTAADKDILGESRLSLSPFDVLGQANRGALTQALTSIQDYLVQLLRSGTPVAQATAAAAGLVKQFTDLATSLGFNATEVNALVDALGLSTTAMQQFGNEVLQITPNAQGRSTLPPPQIVQHNDIDIALPYGDPNAVALATANRLALQARY